MPLEPTRVGNKTMVWAQLGFALRQAVAELVNQLLLRCFHFIVSLNQSDWQQMMIGQHGLELDAKIFESVWGLVIQIQGVVCRAWRRCP